MVSENQIEVEIEEIGEDDARFFFATASQNNVRATAIGNWAEQARQRAIENLYKLLSLQES